MDKQQAGKSARRHHFVSQVYLRGFTHNGKKDTQLFVVGLEQGKTFTTAPANVAHERDFNRIAGFPPGELDNRLGRFEGAAGAAIERIATAGHLHDEEAWLHVLNLAALFAVRHPTMREALRQSMEQGAILAARTLVRDPKTYEREIAAAQAAGHVKAESSVSYEEMLKFIEGGEYRISVPRETHIDVEFRVFEDVLKTMVARRWTLYHAANGAGDFVTSDLPVFLVSATGDDAPGVPLLGHGLKRTALCLPLTRQWFAIGAFEGSGGVIEADEIAVAELNALVLQNAYREVYAPRPTTSFALAGELVPAASVIEYMRRYGTTQADNTGGQDAEAGNGTPQTQ